MSVTCRHCGIKSNHWFNYGAFCSEECRRRAFADQVIELHTPDKPAECLRDGCSKPGVYPCGYCSASCSMKATDETKPMKCKNPNCDQDVPDGIDHCSETCARATPLSGERNMPDVSDAYGDVPDLELLVNAAMGGGLGNQKQKADQKLIAKEVIAWGALALRKNADYGSSVWERPALDPSMDSDSAIKVRMSDKLSRIKQLEGQTGNPHVDESLDDTYRDLGIYCLLKIINPNR